MLIAKHKKITHRPSSNSRWLCDKKKRSFVNISHKECKADVDGKETIDHNICDHVGYKILPYKSQFKRRYPSCVNNQENQKVLPAPANIKFGGRNVSMFFRRESNQTNRQSALLKMYENNHLIFHSIKIQNCLKLSQYFLFKQVQWAPI